MTFTEKLREIFKYHVEAHGGNINPKDDFYGFLYYIKKLILEEGLAKNKEETETCTKCGGLGRVPNHPHIVAHRCQKCNGTGKIVRQDYKIFNQCRTESIKRMELTEPTKEE